MLTSTSSLGGVRRAGFRARRLVQLVMASCLAGGLVVSLIGCDRRPSALAEAGAPTGWRSFEGTWTASGIRRSIPQEGGGKASILQLRGSMLLSGVERPNVGFLVECIGLTDPHEGLVGRSVWTDERGDQVFCELSGEGSRERNRIEGTIVGGTGRYAGISGSLEFSWQFVIESEEGSVQGRAVGLKGRFRMTPPKGGQSS